MHRHRLSPRFPGFSTLASISLLVACAGTAGTETPGDGSGSSGTGSGPPIPGAGASAGPIGGSTGGIGNSGSSSGSSGPGATGSDSGAGAQTQCVGNDFSAAKRIVRLSFNQIVKSIGTFINASLTSKLSTDLQLLDDQHRAFPPLQSPREGNSLTDQSWDAADRIAQAAAKYVYDNFAAVTNCGASPTDDCAQTYLTTLAQKAYRRPLTAAEQQRLKALYTTGLKTGAGATINEAVQYGVYAILQSPQFLYRTEFGADWKTDGPLNPYEMASMLSYFLTDNAPEQQLLDAAAQNKLSTAADIGPHVDRILKTSAAQGNLHGAMMSYFAYPNLETVVIQDAAFTGKLAGAMYREAELFMNKMLWGAPLNEMILSRKGYINADLAAVYGLQFPPAGATLDQNMFAEVDLPANRTGLLTQAGFLANRSRPNETSVVGRGLLIQNAFLCTEIPGPPEGIQEEIKKINAANPNASERELANIRASTQPCTSCHSSFDAYGLVLDTFDMIGRYRAKDPAGRTYDTSVALPAQVGGGTAKDVIEVAQKIAASGGFARCMGRNLVNYALADTSTGSASIASCAVAHVADAFRASDQTFPSLVKAVATSATFATRSKGAAQ